MLTSCLERVMIKSYSVDNLEVDTDSYEEMKAIADSLGESIEGNIELVILIVDGMNLFVRAFVANPAISAHGYHVGGVVGFLNSLRNCIRKIQT